MARLPFPWKPALALWAAGTLLSPLQLPYALGLMAVAPDAPTLPFQGTALVLAILARSAVMLGLAIGLGYAAARPLGLGAPYVEAWFGGPQPARPLASIVAPAAFWALATALLALAIDAVFLHALGVVTPSPEIHARVSGVAGWRGLLAAPGGGLFEELYYRLGFLSVLFWLLTRLVRSEKSGVRTAVFWLANLAVAVYFGIEHFGNEVMWEPLTPLVAWRTVLIILGPGLAFGHLFRQRGLEAAALSHVLIVALVHGLRPIFEHGWSG